MTSEGHNAVANCRLMKGVLHNFLGTFTSRYTEYDGYWLFGFMVTDLVEIEFDLLTSCDIADSPHEVARRIACLKFADQTHKAGLATSQVRQASLTISKLPEIISQYSNIAGHDRHGYNIVFRAVASMQDGREYLHERVVFVAPHVSRYELRSAARI